jgi:hypothetical protein
MKQDSETAERAASGMPSATKGAEKISLAITAASYKRHSQAVKFKKLRLKFSRTQRSNRFLDLGAKLPAQNKLSTSFSTISDGPLKETVSFCACASYL